MTSFQVSHWPTNWNVLPSINTHYTYFLKNYEPVVNILSTNFFVSFARTAITKLQTGGFKKTDSQFWTQAM